MTRTKFFGTFITAACMRVISSAILAFVSSDTKSCSVIAVYNGIRVTSNFGKSQGCFSGYWQRYVGVRHKLRAGWAEVRIRKGMPTSNQSLRRVVFVHERLHEHEPFMRRIQNALKLFFSCNRVTFGRTFAAKNRRQIGVPPIRNIVVSSVLS